MSLKQLRHRYMFEEKIHTYPMETVVPAAYITGWLPCSSAPFISTQCKWSVAYSSSQHSSCQRMNMSSHLKLTWLCPVLVHNDFRIILIRHIHTTTIFLVLLYISSIPQFLTLIVQHVSSCCNSSSGTFIKQFTRLRVASQYALHWVCCNCKIHLL
jgi:hypothetical protein